MNLRRFVPLIVVVLLVFIIAFFLSRKTGLISPLPKEPSIKVMFEGKVGKTLPTITPKSEPSVTPTEEPEAEPTKGEVQGIEAPTATPVPETPTDIPTVAPTAEVTPTVEVSLTPSPTP